MANATAVFKAESGLLRHGCLCKLYYGHVHRAALRYVNTYTSPLSSGFWFRVLGTCARSSSQSATGRTETRCQDPVPGRFLRIPPFLELIASIFDLQRNSHPCHSHALRMSSSHIVESGLDSSVLGPPPRVILFTFACHSYAKPASLLRLRLCSTVYYRDNREFK